MAEDRGALLFLLLAACSALAAACASVPGPGDADYPFNLEGLYRGEISLASDSSTWELRVEARTLPDGTLTGTLRALGADTLRGDFSGTVEGDSLLWRSSWVAPATGCRGLFIGWGGVEAGGGAAEGTARAEGSCAGPRTGGSFHLTR